MLLQVAVVLVRRVLGRAEQRKQCPGQMETLERLRGVREHVQEEEESFIAEVTFIGAIIYFFCVSYRGNKSLQKQHDHHFL